jgi:DnaJ-class molecular chaperone
MHGKGQAIKSGKCGDLIINVSEISHDVYVRSGHNLNLNLKLNYPQLVLGDKISLDTIDGTKILVTIPEHEGRTKSHKDNSDNSLVTVWR